MRSDPVKVEPGSTLWRWAEPLAVDALRSVYRECVEDAAAAEWLAKAHARVWARSAQGEIIDDEVAELDRQLAQYGHDVTLIHDANAAVACELAETLHLRFRRNLPQLGAYALTLEDMADSMRQVAEGATRR